MTLTLLAGLLILLGALGLPTSVIAQGPELPPVFETQRMTFRALRQTSDTLPPPRLMDASVAPATYWVLGGVLGATVVGVGSAVMAHDGICADDGGVGCPILWAGLGGAVGFIGGALVGGLIPKSP